MGPALLGCALAVLPCECLGTHPSDEATWQTLELADRCAAQPGLTALRRADALAESAWIRAELGDYAGAESELSSALLLQPDDPELSMSLADLTRDRPERALEHARRAARKFLPGSRRAAARRLAAEIQIDLGDDAGAESDLAGALEDDPQDLEALRAMVRLKRGEGAAFAARARSSAAAAPLWCRGSAYRLAAQIQLEVRDIPGAMASLGLALDLDPDDLHALQLAAKVRRLSPGEPLPRHGKPPEDGLGAVPGLGRRAAERFTAAIRTLPSWQRLDAYRRSSRLWLALGDDERARSSQRRAEVPGDPFIGSPGADPEVVRQRLELGDTAGAQATLARALGRQPEDPKTLEQMARFLLSQGRPLEAEPYGRRLLAASRRRTLSDILSDLSGEPLAGVVERAQRERQRILKSALGTLADIARASGRVEVAASYSEEARAVADTATAPERAEAFRRLSQIQSGQRDAAGAEASLARSLELAPDDAPSLREMVDVQVSRRRLGIALGFARRLEAANTVSSPVRRSEDYLRMAQIQSGLKDEAGAAASRRRSADILQSASTPVIKPTTR